MTTVLYTAILGESDALKAAPTDVQAFCYVDASVTAAPAFDAKGWIVIPYQYEGDPRRAAWALRCRSHELFPDVDQVIWIDASFDYLDLERLMWEAGSAPLVGMRHPERSSAYEEGPALIAEGQATEAGVARQLDQYRAEGFAPTSLTIAGVLVRRNLPAVRDFNRIWQAQLDAFPDDNTQLSLDYAAWRAGLTIQYLQGTYLDNPYVRYDQDDHRARRRPYLSDAERCLKTDGVS